MIFVSYSWINEEPNGDVLKFVNSLRKHGYDARCDIMYKQTETAVSFPVMMAKCLNEADKVIVVLSKEYKEKADSFKGGVGVEYQYIISDISSNKTKYILVSFSEINQTVINETVPDFLKGREIVSVIKDGETNYATLISKLSNTPEYSFADVNPEKTIIPPKEIETLGESGDIDGFSSTTPFFDYRVRKAFPGIRGLKVFDNPEECVTRLGLLLKKPLKNKKLQDPIWWFRGSSCLYISEFKPISKTKCLMDFDELEIDYLAVYIDDSYYRDFVYVQVKAENPIGVYPLISKEELAEIVAYRGYYDEEYALFNEIPIKRTEYDDDAAVIGGKVVDLCGKATLRIRYLTPYNFIICAKFHPFNSSEGDKFTKRGLNAILRGEMNIETFTTDSLDLPRHRNDYI